MIARTISLHSTRDVTVTIWGNLNSLTMRETVKPLQIRENQSIDIIIIIIIPIIIIINILM